MEGIIYILSNPAMPGIIKIGKTTKEDVKLRMKELYSSGVSEPLDSLSSTIGSNLTKSINFVPQSLHINTILKRVLI